MISFDKYLKEQLKDPEFAKEYKKEKQITGILIQIALERQRQGLTQTELAKRSGITQQQLSKLENGISCTMNTFFKVCNALNLQLELKPNSFSYAD